MKKLSDDIKRILSGLAYQDAAEFLPTRDKMKLLGHRTETRQKPSASRRGASEKPASQRIGLISDGQGLAAPLDYVIDACARHSARLDLLIHGNVDTAKLSALGNRLREAGVDYHPIRLGTNLAQDIVGYVCGHPSLIFLIASPDDTAAKVLVEKVIPRRGGLVPVPLVLIEDRSSTRLVKQSAA